MENFWPTNHKLREKLIIEFKHLRNHDVEPLSTFLDFITYSYMIDNIILSITGTLHQRPISELIAQNAFHFVVSSKWRPFMLHPIQLSCTMPFWPIHRWYHSLSIAFPNRILMKWIIHNTNVNNWLT